MADELGIAEDGPALVERYESLRERALGARPDGHRLGLGVLLGRGLASWMATWRECVPPQPVCASPSPAPPPGAGSEEIVRVLAAMALACAAEA